jgi:hypothetical protein
MRHGAHGQAEKGKHMNHDNQLLIYRQAVNKILTFHHHEIEAGLRRAHEQEEFIYTVWCKLLTLGWQVSIVLDNRFNTIFYIRCRALPISEQKTHINVVLADVAEVVPEGARLYASSRKQDYLSCEIAFYDSIPGG